MIILTAQEMQEADRQAVERYGIPSICLMENAASAVAEVVVHRFPQAQRVAVLCGKGNNGGDGFAAARMLHNKGYAVEIVFFGSLQDARGDARTNLEICRKLGIPLTLVRTARQVEAAEAAAAGADVVVDALFGTGLARPLEGMWANMVERVNALPVPVLAVDVPSGLGGVSGAVDGPAVRAAATVTFGCLKPPHVFPPASEFCGEVVVADIGIPVETLEGLSSMRLSTAEELRLFLPDRHKDAHKGTYGHTVCVCGSMEKPGAAVLACLGALRAGAGLVTCASVAEVLAQVAGNAFEAMGLALDGTPDRTVARAALPRLLAFLVDKDALVVGPGLSVLPDTDAFIRDLVLSSRLPLVLDADGLNAFAGQAHLLAKREAPTVLTPHPGELARFLETSVEEVQADRLAAARRAAEATGSTVVLKGHLTLVALPGSTTWVNPTGNPGMATGGMGDLLSGMIGSFLGQGLPPEKAAPLGVYLHGLAGDLAEKETGPASLLPRDLADRIPDAFKALDGEDDEG
jgi:NAD(P)H-hydrate epimerase